MYAKIEKDTNKQNFVVMGEAAVWNYIIPINAIDTEIPGLKLHLHPIWPKK